MGYGAVFCVKMGQATTGDQTIIARLKPVEKA